MPLPYSLSFILDEHRYEADFMAEEAEAQAFFKRLDEARRTMPEVAEDTTSALLNIQDLQVYPIPVGHKGAEGPEEFVRYVLEEGLNRKMDHLREEDQALMNAAQAMEAACQASKANGAEAFYLSVDFTWNNGGGDDNAFSWTLEGTVDQERALLDFMDQFEAWLEDRGHGYDLAVGYDSGEAPTDTLKDAVRDLVGTLDTNYERSPESLGQAWANVLREAIDEPKPEVTARRRQRPR